MKANTNFRRSLATTFKMELHCLKTEDAQKIFRTPKIQQRKEILAKTLNVLNFDEEDDFKTSILLDIYYENIAFAVEQGFPWSQVCVFFDLFKKLLFESSGNFEFYFLDKC